MDKIANILKEEDLDLLNNEVVTIKNVAKSDTEIETHESDKELKYPQAYDSDQSFVTIIVDFNKREMNDPRVQAFFKRSRHSIISSFISSQQSFERAKRTIGAKGNIYHLSKPNNFRDVQNLFQDQASKDITPTELKLLTSTCWKEKHQQLSTEKTKDEYTGRFRLELISLFNPHTNPF